MAFKLYTNTKFRIYKNRGGRFIPQFCNGSHWESFTEMGTTVNRARRADAEKVIQRKASRLFFGNALIAYVEAEVSPEETRLQELKTRLIQKRAEWKSWDSAESAEHTQAINYLYDWLLFHDVDTRLVVQIEVEAGLYT